MKEIYQYKSSRYLRIFSILNTILISLYFFLLGTLIIIAGVASYNGTDTRAIEGWIAHLMEVFLLMVVLLFFRLIYTLTLSYFVNRPVFKKRLKYLGFVVLYLVFISFLSKLIPMYFTNYQKFVQILVGIVSTILIIVFYITSRHEYPTRKDKIQFVFLSIGCLLAIIQLTKVILF